MSSEPTKDYTLASVAVAVPSIAWLAQINAWLTLVSLLIAVILGGSRIYRNVKRWRDKSDS